MVRTEVSLMSVTEENFDMEMFLSESTIVLIFSTFSAMRVVRTRRSELQINVLVILILSMIYTRFNVETKRIFFFKVSI